MTSSIEEHEIAKFSSLSNHWWDRAGPLKTLHDINPARVNFVQNYIKIAGKSVLDVGCGGGVFAEALAKLGANVQGIDAEIDAIKVALEHTQKSNLDIKYTHTPIESFKNEPFDIVCCMEMLEHVAIPELVINECWRLTKPGGWIFLSTINRTLKAYAQAVIAAEYILNLLPRQTHDYKKFIKPSELAQMLRETGFEVLGTSGMQYNPFTRGASLGASVDVNYLLAARKPEG